MTAPLRARRSPRGRGVPALSPFLAAGILAACIHDDGGNPPAPVPPVLAAIGAQTISEGLQLAFDVIATHPSLAVTVTAAGAPLQKGAAFANNRFTWTPGYEDSGAYTVTFTATVGGLSDTEIVAITVLNRRPPPVIRPIADQTVDEGQIVDFVVVADDPEGATVSYSLLDPPEGASLDGANFVWFPSFMDSGSHVLRLVATAEGSSDTENVNVRVNNVPVSYQANVQPIFDNQCIECHIRNGTGWQQTGGPQGVGLDLTDSASYAALLGSDGMGRLSWLGPGLTPRYRVRPRDLVQSFLVQKIDSAQTPKEGDRMPLTGGALESFSVDAIRAWILEGAANN